MKRMICLLLTLCLLAACAPVIAENPELTEGEAEGAGNAVRVAGKGRGKADCSHRRSAGFL